MYDVSSAKTAYSGPDILAVIFLGVIGGIFGSLYNYLVDKVIRTYSIINEYVTNCFLFLLIDSYTCTNKRLYTLYIIVTAI